MEVQLDLLDEFAVSKIEILQVREGAVASICVWCLDESGQTPGSGSEFPLSRTLTTIQCSASGCMSSEPQVNLQCEDLATGTLPSTLWRWLWAVGFLFMSA